MKKLAPTLLLLLPLFTGCAHSPAAPPQATAATADRTAHEQATPAAADAARLLPLQGALNARTFAGLRGRHGPIPAGSFVRTADLSRLTPADRDALAAAGVALDVDLRTAEEEADSHDALADDARFQYVRISLLGNEKIDLSHMPDSLGEMYVKSLSDNQPQFRQVFKAMAGQEDGAVLFHCTAGKDRTGMVAGLLLSLAGTPQRDIVHNYAVSTHYLQPMMASPKMAEMVRNNPKLAALRGTPPEAMEAFLDALDRRYGGAEAYLKTIGLSEDEVQRLLARLGQAG